MANLWQPAVFQGKGTRGTYFEGWYYKLIDAQGQHKLALIPGIYKHADGEMDHAFIQTLDGATGETAYHRFPLEDFRAADDELDVWIGQNHFRMDGVTLALDDLHGSLTFGETEQWPIKTLSPGVMGPFSFVPGMQCRHGVLSFDHSLHGTLTWQGQPITFEGGRGYIEKDWGKAFPRAYVWMQSNHFVAEGHPQIGTCLTASIATIPFAGSWFRGMIVGFRHEERLYRFTTYLWSRTKKLSISPDAVTWVMEGGPNSVGVRSIYPRYRLEINAERTAGGSLAAPEPTGMIERVVESLTASIHVTLTGFYADGKPVNLFAGTGHHAGLEVSGSVEEIAYMEE